MTALLAIALALQPPEITLAREALAARNPKEAIALYERALESADGPTAAAIEGLLSEVLKSEARYQEALSHAESGLRLSSKAPPELGAKSYRTGAGAPVAPDIYECDRSIFEKLLETPGERSSREIEVCLLMNAAGLYLRQLQFDSARTYYERALQATEEREGEIRTNLAWLEILERRPADAGRWVEPVSPGGSSPRTYLVLGVVLRETGRPDAALPFLQMASEIYERDGDRRGLARSLAHVGTLHLDEGRFQEARASYERALQIAGDDVDAEARWHALGGLARCLKELGDTPGSLRRYEQYLEVVSKLGASFATDQGKVSFLSNHEQVLDDYFHLLVLDAAARGRFDEARAAIENVRARALGSLLAARSSTGQGPPGELALEDLLPGRGFSSQNFANMRAQAAPAVASLPDVSRSEVPEEPVTPPSVTLLEYFCFRDMTAIFVKSEHGITGATVPIGIDALREQVESLRRALRVTTPRGVVVVDEPVPDEGSENLEEIQSELYRLLISPIEGSLPSDPDEVVVLVPHGPLWYLPFAALRKGNGSFLIDEHLLTMAASEESWLFTARRARAADHREIRAWVAGNPRMPARLSACGEEMRFDALPGAETEARRITEILGRDRTDLFTGKQADRLRLEAWHGAFSVIHLATHGVVCGRDPLESFLVLSDLKPGYLRFEALSGVLSLPSDPRRSIAVREVDSSGLKVSSLDLSGVLTAGRVIDSFHLKADLVSLSACQTGLGLLSSDGIIGFSRAFLAAGARSLLMSLWRIDDEASRDWMISFYEEYVSHGNKARALRNAMNRTRQRYPDPRYWAGFGLLGLAE